MAKINTERTVLTTVCANGKRVHAFWRHSTSGGGVIEIRMPTGTNGSFESVDLSSEDFNDLVEVVTELAKAQKATPVN